MVGTDRLTAQNYARPIPGSSWQSLETSTLNDGIYDWTATSTTDAGLFRISDALDGTPFDDSDEDHDGGCDIIGVTP